jgi:hypothetical protein
MSDDRLAVTPPDRLTIADLTRLLEPHGMNRSMIQRYDANKDVQRLLGKEGTTYPASVLEWWKKIAEARKQKPPIVWPETAGVFLESVMQNPEQALIFNRPPISQPLMITPELLEKLVMALTDTYKAIPPPPLPPDDSLLTAEEAARLLACKPEKVSHFVKGIKGRRGVWRRNDILRFIAAQEQKDAR